jgi:hypothetical protein
MQPEPTARHTRATWRWSLRFGRHPADLTAFALLVRLVGVPIDVVGTSFSNLTIANLIGGSGRSIKYGP